MAAACPLFASFYLTCGACIGQVGVSAATGEGMSDLFDAIRGAGQEYIDSYLPELKVWMDSLEQSMPVMVVAW